jgi:hypothetical protein
VGLFRPALIFMTTITPFSTIRHLGVDHREFSVYGRMALAQNIGNDVAGGHSVPLRP